ncbi:MAG: esterase, partial [Mycobacterium sp.]
MTAPSKVSGWPRDGVRARDALRVRIFPVADGVPVEVIESGPSIAARLVSLVSRLTIRPTLAVGSYVPHLPWPWSFIDVA